MAQSRDPDGDTNGTVGGDGSPRASTLRPTAARMPRWLGNVAVWVGAALAVVVVVLLGVAVLPGWWAGLVGGWVHGVQNRGVWLGLLLGAAFTILPLGVAVLAARDGLTSRARIVLVVIALLLLLPNVLTIAIALGGSDARHVVAIQAPGLRGATVAGIVVVVVLALVAIAVRARSRRTRRKLDEARERAIQLARERAAAAAENGAGMEVEAEAGVDERTGTAAPQAPLGPSTADPEQPTDQQGAGRTT